MSRLLTMAGLRRPLTGTSMEYSGSFNGYFFMRRQLTTLILATLALGAVDLQAAVAPLGQKQREKQSELIVTGKVVAVGSRVQKSRVERSFGIHRDRVYTLTIKVADIAKGTKGSELKVGQKIQVLAWQSVVRIPRLPGPQGHGSIPGRGATVTMYLKWNMAEKVWEPLLPNGIEIKKEAKRSS